jgi:hypothetical protein
LPAPRRRAPDAFGAATVVPRNALLDEIEAHGRLVTSTPGVVCYYSPRFRLEGSALTGLSLVRWCEPPPATSGPHIAQRPRGHWHLSGIHARTKTSRAARASTAQPAQTWRRGSERRRRPR